MAVALRSRDRTIGQIGFLAADSGRHYGPDDLALAEDLARRIAAAVDNARLYHDAQRALKLRDEFLSIASHELKTPLTALQLQVQLLERALTAVREGSLDRRRVERFLDGARRQMRRLAKLVNDLLDVSRGPGGKRELQREETDLAILVHDVAERFAAEAAASGSPITLHAAERAVAWVDRFQIDQVITNLLSNAIRYGGGSPIDVCLEPKASTICLTVRDRGIGIAPEHLSLVFDRFERVAVSQNYGGLGLGLYITRQIVEAHGGHISVESTPDTGTIFAVELPVGNEP
jgi:signal transduction histidine kinase